MKNRILMSSIAFLLVGAALAGLAVWLGLPCGPSTCASAGWLFDFQTLVAGVLAIAAAAIAIWGADAIDRRQSARRQIREQESQVNLCIGAATALVPYVLGITEVAELALRESREHRNPSHEPLRMAIPLAEQRCTDARKTTNGVPLALHQKFLSLLAEFEILLFKARVALAYRSSAGASHDIQITGLEDVVRRAKELEKKFEAWHGDPG
jgi:hypothetical protein